tara:strand:+ start:105 stop:248 length:144 start_codon:yes stop_codon:yes gene_type:complete
MKAEKGSADISGSRLKARIPPVATMQENQPLILRNLTEEAWRAGGWG